MTVVKLGTLKVTVDSRYSDNDISDSDSNIITVPQWLVPSQSNKRIDTQCAFDWMAVGQDFSTQTTPSSVIEQETYETAHR